jgi:hypothetical protein
MILRRERYIGMAKGVVMTAGVAFGMYAVLETYVHDSPKVNYPLHAPGSIAVSVTSGSTLIALDSMLVAAIPNHLEYTWGAFTKDLVKDLNLTARREAWIPPTAK